MNSPERIELDMQACTLALHWPDGTTQCIPHRMLRQMCPCAECKRLRLDGVTLIVPEDIVVVEIRPAAYGMQLRFSDDHERGIFPWEFLARHGRDAEQSLRQLELVGTLHDSGATELPPNCNVPVIAAWRGGVPAYASD
jgi:DUF971 family protein